MWGMKSLAGALSALVSFGLQSSSSHVGISYPWKETRLPNPQRKHSPGMTMSHSENYVLANRLLGFRFAPFYQWPTAMTSYLHKLFSAGTDEKTQYYHENFCRVMGTVMSYNDGKSSSAL